MQHRGFVDPRSIERHLERGGDVLGLHGGAQLPGDDKAGVGSDDERKRFPKDQLLLGFEEVEQIRRQRPFRVLRMASREAAVPKLLYPKFSLGAKFYFEI